MRPSAPPASSSATLDVGRGTALVAGAAGAVLGVVTRLRDAKPLHPRGAVYDAVLTRQGTPAGVGGAAGRHWGVPWLDEPGTDQALVRLSRSAGLPPPWPDVLGLALRVPRRDGGLIDVLLSTTGVRPGTRHVLAPRRDPLAASYGSVVPFRGPRGPVMLCARPPQHGSDADDPGSPCLDLCAATLTGPWQPFARLRLGEQHAPDADPDIAFDPVVHAIPGLPLYDRVAALRAVSYARARDVRGVGERGLGARP
jgi:hypothetical protein